MAWNIKSWNPIKFVKRTEQVRCLLIGKNGGQYKFPTLLKEGDFVRDVGKDRVYGPMRLRPLFDLKGKPAYLFNEETGAPLQAVVERMPVEVDPLDGWTATPIYDEDGNKVHVFDEETGRPARIVIDETVIRMKTDPDLMGVLTSKTMLSNALNRQPAIAMLALVGLATLFLGILIGQAMAG
ncbi:hypothetical protein [Methanoplanus limicola]|uniref:Uncharacterized protein n=1 Tax=Methanoplanus limicola DSM 2279 TaxID=937775 RepID=H1Z1B0_9EURY|nr:hypothetical protein [Methanoplanus limicola]EHQ35377.1 hypothetical protein Metlim_1268 [Methanoplanus limicola DSM 2279]